MRTAQLLGVAAALCLLATACRTPGEPPRHPNVGVYRDIIRREADSTHTALATAKLLITTTQIQGLPGTYARVTLRSIVGDLHHVVIDLHQITPPPPAVAPQRRLATIAAHDAQLLSQLEQHWSDSALRADALRQVGQHADEMDTKLIKRLQL